MPTIRVKARRDKNRKNLLVNLYNASASCPTTFKDIRAMRKEGREITFERCQKVPMELFERVIKKTMVTA